jgi:hypothetical protein
MLSIIANGGDSAAVVVPAAVLADLLAAIMPDNLPDDKDDMPVGSKLF